MKYSKKIHILPSFNYTFNIILPFATIDANEDYTTWNWHESGSALMGFSMDKDLDDRLVSAPVRFEAGKAYRLSVDARGESEYYTDIFEVRMGTGKSAADMSTELIMLPPEASPSTISRLQQATVSL